MPNTLLDMDTVIPKKLMTDEEIKLQYITPAMEKSGWDSEQWICKELEELQEGFENRFASSYICSLFSSLEEHLNVK